jgi:hypothetical protein
MIDVTKIPRIAVEWLSGLVKRGQPDSRYVPDDWPEIPAPYKGGDELIAQGLILPPNVPRRPSIEERRTPENTAVQWRDGPA